MQSNITHVIFDMDGLLLNTEDLYTIAFQNICNPYGKVYDWSVKLPIMGMKPDIAAEYVIKTLSLPLSVEQFRAKVSTQLETVFSQSKLLPGAEKLVKHLKKNNIPMAICTGSSREAYEAKTRHLDDFFLNFDPIVLCGSDAEVKMGKPHPDAYEVTKNRFKVIPKASEVLVFEDAPNGVTAALAANMSVIMVPDEHVPVKLRESATKCIQSLEDFEPEEFGLPPF